MSLQCAAVVQEEVNLVILPLLPSFDQGKIILARWRIFLLPKFPLDSLVVKM